MVDISIGNRCNSSCIMCTTIRPEDKDIDTVFVDKDHILQSIQSLSDPEYIAITGGEPSLREDTPEICKVFYEKNGLQYINYHTKYLYDR